MVKYKSFPILLRVSRVLSEDRKLLVVIIVYNGLVFRAKGMVKPFNRVVSYSLGEKIVINLICQIYTIFVNNT